MRKKEQVILMKFTQNVVTGAAARVVGRLCQTPWRFTAVTDAKQRPGFPTPYNRIGAVAAALWAAFFVLTTLAFAQNADNIAEREVQRRQAAIPAGEAALARGKSALHSRNYTVAYQE